MKQFKAHGKQQQVRQVKVHGRFGKKHHCPAIGLSSNTLGQGNTAGMYVDPECNDDESRHHHEGKRDVEKYAPCNGFRAGAME